MQEDQWIQLAFKCAPRVSDEIGALLVEEGALGVQEPLSEISNEKGKPALSSLTAYYSSDLSSAQKEEIEKLIRSFKISSELLWSLHKDDGWSTKWRDFFKPLEIGKTLVVCPSWEKFQPKPEQKILWLEPGMAFGTGQHETTRGCILLIEKYMQPSPDLTVFDVGCGSGILSIAAIMLGAGSAFGVDIDSDVVPIAYENAEKNQVKEQCRFSDQPISAIQESYPFVVANIQAHILKPMATDLYRCTDKSGVLLLSGILIEQAKEIVKTFTGLGLTLLEQLDDKPWCSIAFRK